MKPPIPVLLERAVLQRLASQKALFQEARAILKYAAVGLVVVDAGGQILYANPVSRSILGDAANLPRRLAAGEMEASSHDWAQAVRTVTAGSEPVRLGSVRFLGRGEQVYSLDLTFAPVQLPPAGRGACLVTIEDVTARVELEQRVQAAESMAAVGRLAARVAHELNNPLDGALRYVNLSHRALEKPEADVVRVQSYLNEARQGLLRMVRIVGELLEFARGAPEVEESSSINALVEEAVRALSPHADKNGVVVAAGFHNEDTMPAVEGTRLYQMCCNLIKNAIDAMPDGGCLTVTTGLVGTEVVIKFEDTGVGLPEDVQRVFEPFYTTKATGKGTGLGLAICREYVERMGGTIIAENASPHGAVFTVRIPAASCQPRERS